MVKPTLEQLTLLYPSISTDYLDNCVNRQLTLIQQEEENVNRADVIINRYSDAIINFINNLIQSKGKDKITYLDRDLNIQQQIKDYLNKMIVELVEYQVDVTINTYELSSILQAWILESQFTDNAYEEIGGEQKKLNASIKRNKITKNKASELLKSNNSTKNLDELLKSLESEIIQMYNKWTNSKDGTPLSKVSSDIKNTFKNHSNKVKQNIKSLSQNVAYDAYNNVKITVSQDYQIVYYRVEILDSSICMSCMYVDGSINEKPLDQLHKNCRGIDVVLLRDLETGKYYDTDGHGYGHKLKTKSFESKFEKLSEKQKKRMLGKSNYELYSNGKLKIDDFISHGRQITKREADTKVALKGLKSKIQTPTIATRISNMLEKGIPSIEDMNSKQLLEYEKILGYQKQLYDLVPKKNFTGKTYQSYIDDIDAKHVKILSRREAINKI